ncbi:exodeoxyribonuclease 7 large subunit [Polymorphobacter glacialis]|uniref:Exodeoxyribonuclease 7 large subunit n=1 Tax=Sandarakinorhabdus glacialis TaxID=1614636 RepID=A0A917E9B6_9SPHN|nr:exodeoxyribonuclease VII large subunit [Polymorphobacter glacialis]GGE13475.1 exodeoxyribonuclease 7 large subunit [Polymorphobacter glacialis]
MSDIEVLDAPVGNTPEYSVSEIAGALKRTVETAFGQVRVRGELSGFKRHVSGHCYGAIKDERAVIDLVMFKASAATLGFRPEDGLEVIVTGKLTTFPGRSKYQIIVERMEPAGVGALLAQIEARRLKLAAEGLFDAARKKPLPSIPRVIGVITSPTGAVIRDILHRLADRFPRHVLVWPVAVQGDAAAGQVAAAVRGFNAIAPGGRIPRPDLLIVARGGGSIEDLAAFNEEIVVRAVAESLIPVISAVGHETDTTLVDFASDWRAPTPTAAAERAVPVLAELKAALAMQAARLDRAAARALVQRRDRTQSVAGRLPQARTLLALPSQRADELFDRLPRGLRASAGFWRGRAERAGAALRPALIAGRRDRAAAALTAASAGLDRGARGVAIRDRAQLERRSARLRLFLVTNATAKAQARLAAAARLLGSLGPDQVLARGYALVIAPGGKLVPSAAAAKSESRLTIRFADGDMPVATGAAPPTAPRTPPAGATAQGRLL